MKHINPADRENRVVGYTKDVAPCINCGKPANCLFDIGTPLLVRACTQECANEWWRAETDKLKET